MMASWWSELRTLNQGFYIAAAFFGVLFLWQMIMALAGFDHDADADMDMDGDMDGASAYDDFEHGAEVDAGESLGAFKILSIRSLLAFFTLFTWGVSMYMHLGKKETAWALFLGLIWGTVGMLITASIFYFMRRMTETGNARIVSCVGSYGTVYLDIPEDGMGEVRVSVSKVVTYVKARAADGKAIKAGAGIRVERKLSETSVEVSLANNKPE